MSTTLEAFQKARESLLKEYKDKKSELEKMEKELSSMGLIEGGEKKPRGKRGRPPGSGNKTGLKGKTKADGACKIVIEEGKTGLTEVQVIEKVEEKFPGRFDVAKLQKALKNRSKGARAWFKKTGDKFYPLK